MQMQETDFLRKQAEACKEKAIHYLNSALAIHCDRPQLYLQQGLAYWRKGDIEAMVRHNGLELLTTSKGLHVGEQYAATL